MQPCTLVSLQPRTALAGRRLPGPSPKPTYQWAENCPWWGWSLLQLGLLTLCGHSACPLYAEQPSAQADPLKNSHIQQFICYRRFLEEKKQNVKLSKTEQNRIQWEGRGGIRKQKWRRNRCIGKQLFMQQIQMSQEQANMLNYWLRAALEVGQVTACGSGVQTF